MENPTNHNLLEALSTVYDKAEGSQLSPAYFESIQSELTLLDQYFNTTNPDTFLLSLFIGYHLNNDGINIKELNKYLECNALKMLYYKPNIDAFFENAILEKRDRSSQSRFMGEDKSECEINKLIIEAFIEGKPMPTVKPKEPKDIISFLEMVYKILSPMGDMSLDTYMRFEFLQRVLNQSNHFQLINQLNKLELDIDEKCIFLYLVWKMIKGTDRVDLDRMLNGIYDSESARYSMMQKFIDGDTNLNRLNLIKIEEAEFVNDSTILLSEQGHELLKANDIRLKLFKVKRKDIIMPKDIVKRHLIFDQAEINQIDTLQNLLNDEQYKLTQDRLKTKGLPNGITILLHGAPGTGKTEIAKQLARETDRELMHVNISQSKSMWYGESEKLVKRIFDSYKNYAKECNRIPILFFNEADAIISKRKEISDRNTDQTENAIQNILLEELESFGGILIATTNLTNNLDKAFERRFLFKIKFQQPSIPIRSKIWKMRLPELAESEANYLADSFDFSGGQIDNIIRKKEITEVLQGVTICFDQIVSFCKEEILNHKFQSIGFKITK